MPKTYVRGEYTVTDHDPIRIGVSEVYVFQRDEATTNEPENVFSRIIFALWGNGGQVEIDTNQLPSSKNASDLVKLFSKFL